MKISIFTDASVHETIGGYAFYIGCTKGKIMKAGVLKTPVRNSADGELYCIANALHTLKHSKLKPITSAFVFTDYIRPVEIINNTTNNFKEKNLRLIMDEIKFLMLEICIEEGYNIRYVNKLFTFRHIKAHTGRKDKLSVINNWCDKEAVKYRMLAQKKAK